MFLQLDELETLCMRITAHPNQRPAHQSPRPTRQRQFRALRQRHNYEAQRKVVTVVWWSVVQHKLGYANLCKLYSGLLVLVRIGVVPAEEVPAEPRKQGGFSDPRRVYQCSGL